MGWIICIVIILILAWVFHDRMVVEWNLRSQKSQIIDLSVECDVLDTMLKQERNKIDACRKDKTTCGPTQTESQMVATSSGIGDNQSELSHIRNDLADVKRAVEAKELEFRAQLMRGETISQADYEKFNLDTAAKLAALKLRSDAITKLILSY